MYDFELKGVDELIEGLEKAAAINKDELEKGMKGAMRHFRNSLKKLVWEKVKKHTGNLTSGFWNSKVKGTGMNIEIDFSAETTRKNPHWHLIENGHDIRIPETRNGVRRRRGGEVVGFKPGIKVMPKARAQFEPKFVADMEKARDRILKKAGLL